MNIIICGAGQVGSSIAKHLSSSNAVTIVDANGERVSRTAEQNDLRGVIGISSHPDVLAKAGASSADMIIAVTESDEVNMISCQVAHTIFNTPLKIARVRHRSYLDPYYGDLYSPDHIPIDHIISPEKEVSSAVTGRLKVPGAFDVSVMGDGLVRIIGTRCTASCPIIGSPIRSLMGLFQGLVVTIVAIIRGNDVIVNRDGSERLMEGDQVYFVCSNAHLSRVMATFGHEGTASRNILIAGAGVIGRMVASEISANIDYSRCNIIESDKAQAVLAAELLPGVTIINGDALEPEMLLEGGVEKADTFVALTNDDEANVLSSLLALRFGAAHSISLVNMASFVPLISTLGVDSVINPPAITVSSILRHVRRGRVYDIHAIVEDRGEFMEIEALRSSSIVGVELRLAHLPKGAAIGAIVRDGEVIAPRGNTVISSGDRVILFAIRKVIGQLEMMFSARPDTF